MIALPDAFCRLPLAHRALHDANRGRPENSRAAVRAAIAAGYGIEIDLQLSRDGRAMVFHDDDLGRLTAQTGPLRQRDARDLAAIALRGGDEGIPELPQILGLVAGRVPVLIELKDQHGRMGTTCDTLERSTAAALAGYAGPVAVMSFNPEMVARMADLAPQVPRGLVTCSYRAADWPLLPAATRERLRAIADYDRVGASFISHAADDLDRPRVADLKARGARVLAWTLRTPEDAARARRLADNITFEGYLPPLDA